MNNTLQYKGFIAKLRIDDEENMIYGEVIGVRTVLTCAGRSIAEIKKSFRSVVDAYLGFCAAQGIEPEKRWKGKLSFRPRSDEMRVMMQRKAIAAGKSVNEWLNQVVERELAASIFPDAQQGMRCTHQK